MTLADRLRVAGWPVTCSACRREHRADLAAAERTGRLACPGCGHTVQVDAGVVGQLAIQLAGLPMDQLDEAFARGI